MIGTVLGGRYELKEKIGEGGMADVYTAHCRILDRIVAVKILKEVFSQDKSFVHKFRTEALAAARLSHPNIVNIFDVGEEESIHYIVMEYIEGQTLQRIINEQAPLPVKKAVDIAIMICYGIQHAHERGIIHRDIKPHNILITTQGTVKVADFGIAQAVNKKTITFGGDIEGSVHYISPEQAKGDSVSPATDIYSLGCVLYEMLTAKPPFDAESMITVALKHIHDEPQSPRISNPLIPLPLEKIVLKAMEKVPSHRYASAWEMSEDLLQVQANMHTRGNGEVSVNNGFMPHEGGEGDTLAKKRKLSPVGIVLILAALIGFLSGVAYVFSASFFGEEIVVPDIVGMTMEDANKTLLDNGLTMSIKARNFDDEIEKDRIISQKPVQGLKVKKKANIEVTVSDGPQLESVPNLVGKGVADAKVAISNAGFEVGLIDEEYDDQYKENIVMSQDPRYGTSYKKGSAINLMVSKGPAPDRVSMPNLIGMELGKAQEALTALKLLPGNINYEENQEYYNNYVIKQDTAAGVLLDEGSSVNLTISKGPGPVAKTRVVKINIPDDEDYYNVQVTVNDAKGEREVYNEYHPAGDKVNVAINYFGTGKAVVRLNGQEYDSINL
ncbi:serine/threonine protein kinase prkc, regulator of stationary phase [hydrocarbon metagenome]|uniref:Serine/threonine protein kinase prkc, regulator of stationary phase n=1 Tax=hydrocarbon metagenome TaxID=938273 RepID=A0A0W8E590_9ZZZZ